jgi:hypothetical protein
VNRPSGGASNAHLHRGLLQDLLPVVGRDADADLHSLKPSIAAGDDDETGCDGDS